MALTPHEEKVVRGMIEREAAAAKAAAALADAEAALEAAQAARQAAVTQAELAAMEVVSGLNRKHAGAINAAFAAVAEAKAAASAAAAPVKPTGTKP